MTYEAFYEALNTHIEERKAFVLANMGDKNIRTQELERLEDFIADSDVGGE